MRALFRSLLAILLVGMCSAVTFKLPPKTQKPRLSAKDFKGKNIILFLTDQERATQQFPPGWEAKNLPGLTRLKKNGLTFKRAYTNACMCSPARSSLFTGFLPAQTGVKYTLEEAMPATLFPNVELPLPEDLPNLAQVAKAAGYNVVYKGKFHISKPENANYTWAPSDLAKYGYDRWNPKDAGANQSLVEGGGGGEFATSYGGNNDYRFMYDDGPVEEGQEGVLAYIRSVAAQSQPFFLVISLVNPHDVLFYPNTFNDSGYNASMLTGDISIPPTWQEDLSTKPAVQAQFVKIFQASGVVATPNQALNYLNFYANLIKESDSYLVQALEALDEAGLTDDTVIIRSSDHGEGGLSHGGQRQKNFNMYEQSTRIPLVFSNPLLWPAPVESDALVSHIDMVPTLASLLSAPKSARLKWEGRDYSTIVYSPKTAKPVQDYVFFSYNDYQSGQTVAFTYPDQPNNVAAIIESRYKFARYYNPAANPLTDEEFEMYDLKKDPLEKKNLAFANYKRTPAEQKEYIRLRKKLVKVEAVRTAPLPLPRDIAVTAATQTVSGGPTAFAETGTAQGNPIGSKQGVGGGVPPFMTLNYTLTDPTATSQFKIFAPIGTISGEAVLSYSVDGGNVTSFVGTAKFLAGIGAFRGIKAEGLAFTATKATDGSSTVGISGTAFY